MPRLSDHERQEIRRLLDADRPLPDKYRFLLFKDKRDIELVWNGKINEVCNVVLPFQTIEQVDEPRTESGSKSSSVEQAGEQGGFLFDARGRQKSGWSNKLIWGDNKLILSSLKNGPMRREIEAQGGIKLIYIDPPFDVGANFSMYVEVGDKGDTLKKEPSVLEEIAYRDTWGKGQDSFIAMIYERLQLIYDLLADDGSIYVHCDWRVNSLIRLAMDEIFGANNLKNEIVWCYTGPNNATKQFHRKHETIWFYGKEDAPFFADAVRVSYKAKNPLHLGRGFGTPTASDKEAIEERLSKGKVPTSWWADGFLSNISAWRNELVNYPTQKPDALLERIIKASSCEGDLVADFFCGSGTTAAVAEKLGRKWIAADLGKFAIHTTRKRMIGVQRQLKKDDKSYRAFEVLNLGKYERQHFLGINVDLREKEQRKQLLEAKEDEFRNLILSAYKSETATGFQTFHGKKSGRMVVIGPVDLAVSRLFVEEVILEAREKRISKLDILGFEFEMGLFPNLRDEARKKGIDIQPKYIPADVFDKRAVERNQVVFHDVAYIEARVNRRNKNEVAVELIDFSVYYQQDSIVQAENTLSKKSSGNKIVIEKGQVVKVSRNNKVYKREVLTKKWSDWIDYWSVDFDFENKREIIQTQDPATNEWKEYWTGEYVFENEWQSFRTQKNRSLELRSAYHPVSPGRRKIAVKVVDIFGNDTMTLLEVKI